MFSQAVSSRFRHLFSFIVALSVLLLAQAALAAGRVEWKEKEPKEREGGSWRLEVAIYLPRAPDVPHVPMKFEFQPTAYYERAMMDGDKLVERVVPLDNRQSLIESVDVGFLDSGSGKIESRTRFTFKVTRAHGYEAGEYKVTILDGRNGQKVGTPVTLKFKGENEVIDRRAMVFSGEKKKKKKDSDDADAKKDDAGSDSAKSDSASKDSSASDSASKDSDSSDASASDSSSNDSGDEPQTVKEKPGGCGCRVDGSHSAPLGASGLPLMLALGLWARRFRRRSR